MLKPGQFYDAETEGPIQVVLIETNRPGRFRLGRRCGYVQSDGSPIEFPADLGFETDLTSVPRLLTWLVPKIGTHLPAALLHDWLVGSPASPVSRREADTIFRDSMAALGVPLVRRWLMWAAVSMATATGDRARGRLYYRILTAVSAVVIFVLGVLATRDLFVEDPLLPWMRAEGTWGRVLGGAIGALVVPILLSIPWFLRWRQAAIAGVALAFLLHVTAAIIVVLIIYRLSEVVMRPLGRLRPVAQPTGGPGGPGAPSPDGR